MSLVTIQNGGNSWLLPGVLHLAYSFALKSEQTSVAKEDKQCAKLAFKNAYASGTLEDYWLQTCREMGVLMCMLLRLSGSKLLLT